MKTLYYLFALGCGLALGFLAVGEAHAEPTCPVQGWSFSPPCPTHGDVFPDDDPPHSVPEPGTLLLLGIAGAAAWLRRRK